MKSLKKCQDYQELITEAVDGLISPENSLILKAHFGVCKQCENTFKSMKKELRLLSSLRVKEPYYLESKIMAAVREAQNSKKQDFAFNLRHILVPAASFMTVLLVAFFINNNTAIVKLPDVAQAPAVKKVTVAKAQVTKKAEVAVVKEVPAVQKEAVKEEPVKTEAPAQEVALEQVAPSGSLRSAPETQEQGSEYTMKKESSSYSVAAKPTEIPPAENPLLEQDKAIVANNLIDPNSTLPVTIRIKVEADSKVKVIIYDRSINEVARLVDEMKTPGIYSVDWFGRNSYGTVVAEGTYYVYIQIGQRVIKKNIIVSKP